MIIINKTGYDTRSLQKFFLEVCRQHYGDDAKKWRWLKVYVANAKGKCPHGHAWLNSNSITVFLPTVEKETNDLVRRQTAWVGIHELYHRDGWSHQKMRGGYYHKWEEPSKDEYARCSFADKLLIESKKVIVRPKEDIQITRYKHVMEMIDEITKVINRKKTLLKKWDEKRKYYEHEFVLSGKVKL